MFEEPGQNKGRGLVEKNVEFPCKYIAGRPKAAFLFWFFSDFRCSVLLFIILLLIYYREIGTSRC